MTLHATISLDSSSYSSALPPLFTPGDALGKMLNAKSNNNNGFHMFRSVLIGVSLEMCALIGALKVFNQKN